MRSCYGWKLNKLPKVKDFINTEAANYNVTVEYKGGDPRLVFLDENGIEVEEINVSSYEKEGIGKLLEERGFFRVNPPYDVAVGNPELWKNY